MIYQVDALLTGGMLVCILVDTVLPIWTLWTSQWYDLHMRKSILDNGTKKNKGIEWCVAFSEGLASRDFMSTQSIEVKALEII